jgi:alkanesulfonate monooxygenase SsuD/methylene tetrahydromethanopterin reductase-like flavin-dependent oxidoreductase (luciferase family)
LVGTPAEVTRGLQQFCEATGYERVLLVMALPGLRTELALRSMRLFAEAVAPKMAPLDRVAATGFAGTRSSPR